jgi:hypothetical protein
MAAAHLFKDTKAKVKVPGALESSLVHLAIYAWWRTYEVHNASSNASANWKIQFVQFSEDGKERLVVWYNDIAISLTKEGSKITFEIIIPTPEGMVFVMYFNQNEETSNMNVNGTGPRECEWY